MVDIQKIKDAIDKVLDSKHPNLSQIVSNRTNFINGIAQHLGYDKLSMTNPEEYDMLTNYVTEKLKGNTMQDNNNAGQKDLFTESKNVLNETSFEVPTPRIFNRYDDDIVVKAIKEIVSKEFDNVKLMKITGEEGGAFYNMMLSIRLEEDIRNDIERKRFYIMQIMSSFRAKFFSAISAVLPVINMNTGSYEFTKNSDVLSFSATICLSHTNDRDWVSGVYRPVEDKKKAEFDKIQDKKDLEQITEAPRHHAITPMPLAQAITKYKAHIIDKKMLETAIKACGRNELEFYVLRSLGIKIDVDISDVDSGSKGEDKPFKHKDVKEMAEEKPMQAEAAGPRFDVAQFNFVEKGKRDIFDVSDELKAMGCKVNIETTSKLTVRWPNSRLSEEDVLAVING